MKPEAPLHVSTAGRVLPACDSYESAPASIRQTERGGAFPIGTLEGVQADLSQLSGSELASLLLEEMKRRSSGVTPTAALARLSEDRFTRSATADPAAIRRIEGVLAEHLPPGTTELQLAPLAPFGTHAAVGGVHQHRVVTTIRGQEVAADPTTVLALEAARVRRRLLSVDPKNDGFVSLAAFQRVTRAQRFEGSRSFAHFAVSGLVTAGRDSGGERFHRHALGIHIDHVASGLLALGCEHVQVSISDFTGGRLGRVIDEMARAWDDSGVSIVAFPERTRARSYYTDLAIEIHVEVDGERLEVGDGGMVDWSQRLVASRKERMMTSGLGVERLALVLGPSGRGIE